MLFSLTWIRDYVDVAEDADVLARRLTLAGLPVDRVERPAAIPDGVVVAKVLEVERHPNADKLSLCRVDPGEGEPLSVVCGAPNVRAGMFSPLATVGTKLPNGLTIRKSKIRGEVSHGMLCSEIELGLGEDADGILDLEPAAPGTPYAHLVEAGDVTLEIDVASNRGDCLSHLGIAREIAALTGRELRLPGFEAPRAGAPVEGAFEVGVEDPEDCPRFTAHIVRGVKIGPSPAWLVRRLESVGQRSINNVVDVTNFILQEMGQPLHSFDLDRLGTNRILIRRARAGETFTTLDGVERKLDPEILMVTDGERPVAVAGVMGGANTEVQEDTVNVLLESAFFLPQRVLRGSRNLRLDTEASVRFRRGVDPVGVLNAARRAAALLAEVAGGEVAPGMAESLAPSLLAARTVPLRPGRVGEIMGDPVGDDEVEARLLSFGFGVERGAAGEPWTVSVPSWRRDVFEDCDLVEEVGRHRGYDKIGVRAYNESAVNAPLQPEEMRRRRVSEILRGFGFHEARDTALAEAAAAVRAGLPEGPVRATFFPVLDPPSREQEGLRVSLLPGLLGAVAHNLRHGQPETRLFETGKVFAREPGAERPRETMHIGLAAAGGEFGPSLERAQRALNLSEFKGFVEGLLAAFQIDGPKWRPYDGMGLVPAGSLEVLVGKDPVGFVWEASPEVSERWDLNRPVLLAQVRMDALPLGTGQPLRYREPSRYPSVRRDLALVVPSGITQAEVRGWLRGEAGPRLAGLELFDHYRGKHIPAGHVGLGFSLTFRAGDRTLEEAEVDQVVDRLVAALHEKGISRREG